MFDFLYIVWRDFIAQSPTQQIGFLVAVFGISFASFAPPLFRLGRARKIIDGLDSRIVDLRADLQSVSSERDAALAEVERWRPDKVLQAAEGLPKGMLLGSDLKAIEDYQERIASGLAAINCRRAIAHATLIVGKDPVERATRARNAGLIALGAGASGLELVVLLRELDRLILSPDIAEIPSVQSEDELLKEIVPQEAFSAIWRAVAHIEDKEMPALQALWCGRALAIIARDNLGEALRFKVLVKYIPALIRAARISDGLDAAKQEIARISRVSPSMLDTVPGYTFRSYVQLAKLKSNYVEADESEIQAVVDGLRRNLDKGDPRIWTAILILIEYWIRIERSDVYPIVDKLVQERLDDGHGDEDDRLLAIYWKMHAYRVAGKYAEAKTIAAAAAAKGALTLGRDHPTVNEFEHWMHEIDTILRHGAARKSSPAQARVRFDFPD